MTDPSPVTSPTFLVTYQYVPDMEQRRTPHRPAHLDWLREHAAAGRLILAGATLDPVDTAILVVRAADILAVRRMLLDDPYAAANLIVGVTVRPIGVAVGAS
ncbi:YciI family protein [Actinomycetes bacterium KLBMP 9797]